MSNQIQGKPAGVEKGGVFASTRRELTFDPKKSIPGANGEMLDPGKVDLINEILQPGKGQLRAGTVFEILAGAERPLFRDC